MNDVSEIELLRQWHDGNTQAGDALICRHYPSVYRFLRRRAPAEQAKDLAQKTFIACLENPTQFEPGRRFRAFILGVARNTLLSDLRSDRRRTERVEQWGKIPIREPTTPSGGVARREDYTVLHDALGRLSEPTRMTVELYYWDELTTSEIASVLGVTSSAVKMRLAAARKSLKEIIHR